MAEAAKKKPDLAVVIGVGGKPKKGPADSEPDEMDEDMEKDEGGTPEDDAMGEFKSALDSGDNARAVEAFKILYDLCHSGGGKGDEGY